MTREDAPDAHDEIGFPPYPQAEPLPEGALPPSVIEVLRLLQRLIGIRNAQNGWHDRSVALQAGAASGNPRHSEASAEALTDHAVATLALIDTEVAEGIEELRNGRGAAETYYPTAPDYPTAETAPLGNILGQPPYKPEGVPSELADVVIRAFDFAARFDIDLPGMISEKLAYNATRGKMHGGKKL